MNFKHYFITFLIMISGNAFSQTISLQYAKISASEIRFDLFYQGPSVELQIPARGRILHFTNQTDVSFRNNSVIIGSKDSSTSQHALKFSYSFIIPNQGGFGSIGKDWFPIARFFEENLEPITYTVTSSKENELFIYPYIENIAGKFTFLAKDQPKLTLIKFTNQIDNSQSLPISLFKSSTFTSELAHVAKTYEYLKGYFGDLGITEIIVINNQLVGQEAFIYNSKLYLLVPRIATTKHLQDALAMAWTEESTKVDSYSLTMLKDAVTRFDVLLFDQAKATGQATNTASVETTTNQVTNSSIQKDPSYILPIPTASYYEELLTRGFTNNTIINVNAPEMIKYYGVLHMAWIHVGVPEFLAGVKAFFNQQSSKSNTLTTSSVATSIPESTTNASSETTTNTSEVSVSNKQDEKKVIDWNIITQNKLQDPLFSLYTKEILVKNPIYPILKADGRRISRNSYFIPSLTVMDQDGGSHQINWDNFLSAQIDISSGSYHLDSERNLPQDSMLLSYYTFNTDEQAIRRKVLFTAEKNTNPNERNLRKHLEIIKLNIPSENAFEVTGNKSVYVVVSHILSSQSGLLKDSIKETFITVDLDNNNRTTVLATRFRV
ncbi:MAG: hypothetical protein ACRCTJ_02520 [Brevinema sp.]